MEQTEIQEQIYESNHTVVFRAQDSVDSKALILKLSKQGYPTPEQLARFRHEFEMINALQLDGVIQAYKLVPYKNRLLLELEDFGGESLANLLPDNKTDKKPALKDNRAWMFWIGGCCWPSSRNSTAVLSGWTACPRPLARNAAP